MAPLFGSGVHVEPDKVHGEFTATGTGRWMLVDARKSSGAKLLSTQPWCVQMDKETVFFHVSKHTTASESGPGDYVWVQGSVLPRRPLAQLIGRRIYADRPGCVTVAMPKTSFPTLMPMIDRMDRPDVEVKAKAKATGPKKRKAGSSSSSSNDDAAGASPSAAKKPRRGGKTTMESWTQGVAGNAMDERLQETSGQQRFEYASLSNKYRLAFAGDSKAMTVTITGGRGKPRQETFALVDVDGLPTDEAVVDELQLAIAKPSVFWSRVYHMRCGRADAHQAA